MHAVPPNETVSALGFYQVVRNVELSRGSAAAAAILASHSGAGGQPTVDGYQLVLWVVGAICLGATGVACVPTGEPPRHPQGRTRREPYQEMTSWAS